MNTRKLLGIRFSDNDFGNTVRAFLRCILDTGIDSYNLEGNLGKEKVVELFNRSAPGLYWLCQNLLRDDKNWDPSTYLIISAKNVFLDDEVTNYIQECKGRDDSEFHVLDTQAHIPYIYSV